MADDTTTQDIIAQAIGDPGSVLPRAGGESVPRWSARAVEAVLAPSCVMKHQPPMDFAFCETHDETFQMGEKCKFDGREPWEVYAEEADKQRQRAVQAEFELELLRITPDTIDELLGIDPNDPLQKVAGYAVGYRRRAKDAEAALSKVAILVAPVEGERGPSVALKALIRGVIADTEKCIADGCERDLHSFVKVDGSRIVHLEESVTEAPAPEPCPKTVGTRPDWMGVDQWDGGCACLLVKDHEPPCVCEHTAPERSNP